MGRERGVVSGGGMRDDVIPLSGGVECVEGGDWEREEREDSSFPTATQQGRCYDNTKRTREGVLGVVRIAVETYLGDFLCLSSVY